MVLPHVNPVDAAKIAAIKAALDSGNPARQLKAGWEIRQWFNPASPRGTAEAQKQMHDLEKHFWEIAGVQSLG